jgi:glutamyl-tRNA reductase
MSGTEKHVSNIDNVRERAYEIMGTLSWAQENLFLEELVKRAAEVRQERLDAAIKHLSEAERDLEEFKAMVKSWTDGRLMNKLENEVGANEKY